MLGIGLAFAWFTVISLALVGAAVIERRHRIPPVHDRPELAPRRALWGGGLLHPPARHMGARALASSARIVRARTRVGERSGGLRFAARAVACIALASGLSLVPFAGRFGGRSDGAALVVVDLQHGLVALVLFVSLAAMAQVAVGLAEASPFARLACVRLAGRVLALAGTLAVVLAPIAVASDSLRLHAIVLDQEGTFAPFALVAGFLREGGVPSVADSLPGLERFEGLEWCALPAWHVFRQPLTALLFLPVLGLLVRRPLALDPIGGGVRLSAFGHDDDPGELYWSRIEERLAGVLFAALFVALFLGAGALPFVSTARLVLPLVPFFGEGLPALLGSAVEMGVFLAKCLVVLVVVARVSRSMPALRDDQWIRIVTRRILPLAWANLLLVFAARLLLDAAGGATS